MGQIVSWACLKMRDPRNPHINGLVTEPRAILRGLRFEV